MNNTFLPLEDTYFYLLENPTYRQIGLCGDRIRYQTAKFNPQTYSSSRGVRFRSFEEAYLDWLHCGRQMGCAFNGNEDTLLKIILKAKDEPELIEKWISHHADIVGFSNIVILDCGSTDQQYLSILRKYESQVLIFRYGRYYNDIHSPQANKSFYQLMSRSCRYLAVLDADEFLFGYEKGELSRSAVKNILGSDDEAIFAGTWLNNFAPLKEREGHLAWDEPISLRCFADELVSGTVAGKSIIRSDHIFNVSHVGHNLHVLNVADSMTVNSFGRMFIIHLKNLDHLLVRRRAIKHLRSKAVLPQHIPDSEVENFLRCLPLGYSVRVDAAKYVEVLLNPPKPPTSERSAKTKLLFDLDYEFIDELSSGLGEVDFMELLSSRRRILSEGTRS